MTDCFVFENESFTTDELFQQLGFSTYPTDRELEAKLIMHLRKYNQSMEENHQRLFRFFTAVYDFFFEQEEEELEKEDETEKGTTGMDDETVVEGMVNPDPKTTALPDTKIKLNSNTPTIVNPVAYTGDVMNPILKQTIQRIIVVDSAYRNLSSTNARLNPLSTSFTIELSEPLRDVLSLKLYSYTIPYSWYTVNNDFGSNFFILKGTTPGLSNSHAYDFKITVPPGNYSATTLETAINDSFTQLASVYSDVRFGSKLLSYNVNNVKATFQVDIQNLYREPSFQLQWHDWSTPSLPNRSQTITNAPNIPLYLGFDATTYDLQMVYSKRNSFPPKALTLSADLNKSVYSLNENNNSFQIIHYYRAPQQDANGVFFVPEYTGDVSEVLDTFTLTLNLPKDTSYSRQALEQNLQSCLQSAVFLNGADLSRIDQTDGGMAQLCSNPNPLAIDILESFPRNIFWDLLSSNPAAISLLQQHPDKINWEKLSENPSALPMLQENGDMIDWDSLSRNPSAIFLLEQNLDKINWVELSKNPEAIHLLEQNSDKIHWYNLSANPSAISLLEKNMEKVSFGNLSNNPAAIHLLEQNLDKANWTFLSANPEALGLLEGHWDMVNNSFLSKNPSAMCILERHPDKVDPRTLFTNPSIFDDVDYACK